MRSSTPYARAALAVAAGLVCGWFLATPVENGAKDGGESSAAIPAKSTRTPGADRVTPQSIPERIAAVKNPVARMRAMVEFANALPDEELLEWWTSERFKTGDVDVDRLFREIISDRLAGVDPIGAIESSRGHLMGTIWARLDGEAAEAYLLGLADPERIIELFPGVLMERAKQDPVRALSMIEKLHELQPDDSGRAHKGLRILAKTAREASLAAAESWPKAWRERLRVTVAEEWLEEDLRAAVSWMQEEEDGKELFVEGLSNPLGRTTDIFPHLNSLPAGWLAAAARLQARSVVWNNPVAWIQSDPAELGIEEDLHRRLVGSAVRRLTYRDLQERPELFGSLSAFSQRTVARQVGRELARIDREEADLWIANLPTAALQGSAREAMQEARRRYEPISNQRIPPSDVLRTLAAGEKASRESLRQRWTSEEAVAGREEFRQLGEVERRNVTEAMVTGSAPRWLLEEGYRDALERGATTDGMVFQLCEHAADWARFNPARASQWAVELPAGEARRWALRNVALGWAEQSPSEARAWAESLSNEGDRDAALQQVDASLNVR